VVGGSFLKKLTKKNKLFKEGPMSALFDILNVLITAAVVVVTFYPLLYVVLASFSNGNSLLSHVGPLWKPLNPTLDGYRMVFRDPMIVRGYANTIFVVVVGSFISMVVTIMAAYFLARKNVMLQKGIMIYIILTMFFSGGMIPFYFTVRGLGLYNTLWALIIPTTINTFNLVILKTNFASLPESLIEAAVIDGADHFRILWTVFLPLSKATLAVISLYYMVGKWNEWFNAMLFLQDREKYPLQLVLRGILLVNDNSAMTSGVGMGDQEAIGESIKYGVIVVSTIPILCIYPFLQKYFVSGTLIGAVKE